MRSLLLPLTVLLVMGLAPDSIAQTRSIVTSGTSTGTGTTHITIEDFDKPGRRDGSLLATSPQAIYVIDVPIQAGWTCAQTTIAIRDSLVAHLAPAYSIQIAPTNDCIIYIQRLVGGYAYNVILVGNAPGQIIRIDEGAVPVVSATWGEIKSRYRDSDAVRFDRRR